ncbi:MAG TPA: phage/plasmid primase, P4 family [Acidobacteriaceae bacterium]
MPLHTDLGNARRLIERHGDNLRYIPEWEKWIVWREERWSVDSDGHIMRLAKDTVDALYNEAMQLNSAERDALLKHGIKSQAEPRLRAMVKLAETEAAVVLSAQELDKDPWLLGVQNGVIELRSQHFRPARREDYVTKHCGVAFDPGATCRNWMAFLDTVTQGDTHLQQYLCRLMGYTITGSVREELMVVLYGTGRNGKSTFRETLHALLGDYALAADAGLLTEQKRAGGASEEVARLRGRRFVAVNETAENEQMNEARVKFITSQDMISARSLYGHLFDFYPTHKTFLTTNHKPIVRGTDEGIWRRVQLIPFTACIDSSKVEKDFRERRLMPELPGILNFALVGLAAYLKDGLNPAAAIVASTQEYRSEMDVVGQWLSEHCVSEPKASVATADAYANYELWAEEEIGWKISKLKFRRQLTERGYGRVTGTHNQRRIGGMRLKTVAELSNGSEGGPVPESGVNTSTAQDTGQPGADDELLDTRIRELVGKSEANDDGQGTPSVEQTEAPLRDAA